MSDQDTRPTHPTPEPLSDEQLGLAGRTARFFINSPLSPLFFMAMMLMGLMGLLVTPRQEDPQISVPMVDIFVSYPGASAQQVSTVAIAPLERIMSEIQGVKHVYSASERGRGMVTIQFEFGEQMGPSLVKVNDKIQSNMDKIPPGVSPPLIKARGIDDVPAVNVTLWSKDVDKDGVPDVDDGQLRMLALDVLQSVKEIPNTGSGFVVGGRRDGARGQAGRETSGHDRFEVKGRGKGGRNTEFVLAALTEMIKAEVSGIDWLVLSLGTDGIDGPTDAAGAWADERTIRTAGALGLDPVAYLDDNDSYFFFKQTGNLIVTGPTGTNVMDLRLFLLRGARTPA